MLKFIKADDPFFFNSMHSLSLVDDKDDEDQQQEQDISAFEFFKKFPQGVIGEVFSFLDTRSFGRCFRVCKHWNELMVDNEKLWRIMALKRWKVDADVLIKISEKNSWKDVFQICERTRETWRKENLCDGIVLKNKTKTAMRRDHDGLYPYVLSNKSFSDESDSSLFQVAIESPAEWVLNTMSVGIVTPEIEDIGYGVIGKTADSFGIAVEKTETKLDFVILHQGEKIKLEGEVKQGDVIGFVFDCRAKEVFFLKNGRLQYQPIKISEWPKASFCAGASLASDNTLRIIDQQEFTGEISKLEQKRKFVDAGSSSDLPTQEARRIRRSDRTTY